MTGRRRGAERRYRTRGVVPAIAVALALLSAGLGQVAQARILAQPAQPITFVVDQGLPYGITQASVDAAANGRALSYEPFTIMLVGRELTWRESQHGEFPPGVDVMLSVGIDQDDPDVSLPDVPRVSVAKLATGGYDRSHYSVASDIRETYINNLTQGQGPSAAVGAAMTAASRAFDGGTRSPVFWIAVAALPLLVALLMMALWARRLARERKRRRTFSRARLELARVVLELDLLEAQVLIADAELERGAKGRARKVVDNVREQLDEDWSAVRDGSLELAHEEQVLARDLLDPGAPVHERGAPDEPPDLSSFAARTAALRRRADALVAASSLRVGHASGGTVLGRIALASTLAIDDLLQRRDLVSDEEAGALGRERGDLMALVREGDTAFGTDDGPDVVVRHADLLARWRRVEHRLSGTLTKMERRLEDAVGKRSTLHIAAGALDRRVRDRTLIVTAGASDTLDELRASLDLTPRRGRPPSHQAERVLLLTEALDEAESGAKPARRRRAGRRVDTLAPDFTPFAVVGLPLVAAVVAGFLATSAMSADETTRGRALVGDQPLAALTVVGDPALLPAYRDERTAERYPPNIETLSLGLVRAGMERNATFPDAALLPERLELVVALLPLDDYVTVGRSELSEHRITLDFLQLLDVYPRIKQNVAAASPAAIDPATGDVRPGYAVLPLWIGDDGSYGVGLPLTGTLSTGVGSRLGAYDFRATEPLMYNGPNDDRPLTAGDLVASQTTDLGRELEYNGIRSAGLPAPALFWTVALATWTGIQAIAMVGWSLTQLLLRGAGSRRTRRQLRDLRESLNALALGLDLSRLDAVAVLGSTDGHRGQAAEADQQLYETMLFTAWREVQELEALPRREQRGPEWRTRVERMATVIEALSEREAEVTERALTLVRSYS